MNGKNGFRINDLLMASTALAEIIDQPVNEHGVMRVRYTDASELIRDMQLAVKSAVEELTLLYESVSGCGPDAG